MVLSGLTTPQSTGRDRKEKKGSSEEEEAKETIRDYGEKYKRRGAMMEGCYSVKPG